MDNPLKKLLKSQVWDRVEKREMARMQSRLRNRDFTLICSNCCAGVMYHLLGQRFDSPTINIWMNKKDFCRFASDLPFYMEQELLFYPKEGRTCPCAMIGEGERAVPIDFVHYKTEQDARQKWEERKRRIHWDNLFIITCDGDKSDAEDFALLDRAHCRRKIVFTSHEHPEIKDSFVLHTMKKYPTAGRMQLTRHPITGKHSWRREFDYAAWLNGEDSFRLK
ncbi:MAG: DUF1919 domain-containing protein [Clostridia bacterium]|nr:DUF1919 domain-containing protein [Clostridia bacterium]